ncbi:MAG: YidC/Oxa1 family membrane protein insertase [Clostridia bacterium]|jgi:YidC/Oxa1 family membrane protein insertase|nr:YidC/Oxa1 family membrane protein insertase [Clostridia bacterium]
MAFLTGIAELLHNPSGLWEILILRVFDFIGNYGWRILFFTVCLKMLLLPLDIYQRVKMRKNQRITERLQPQIEKLQQQYAGDKQKLAQKQMELNRKEGFSYFSSCLPMIVTLVIFFYLFSGLNNISRYKNFKQYVELYDAYTAVELVEKDLARENVTVGETVRTVSWNQLYAEQQAAAEAGNDALHNDLQRAMQELYNNEIKPKAQQAAVDRYEGTGVYKGNAAKESFLWVSNIWSPDVPWRKAILSYSQFKNNITGYKSFDKVRKKLKVNTETPDANGQAFNAATFENMLSESTYNNVTGLLRSDGKHNKVNGFLILPILSVGLSFLSQFITARLQKRSGQAAPEGGMAGSMKMMMFLMPVMMGMFALTYTAMFTLYIVVNSGTTILINVITTLAMEGGGKRKQKKLTAGVQKYGRPDPKDL